MSRGLTFIRVIAAALVGLLLSLAAPARADDTADEAEYRFRRGAQLYAKHDFEGALGEFFSSNRLVHNHNVVFNIARTLEQLGRVNEAYRYYASLLDEKLPEPDKREVEASLKRLQPRVALLVVKTTPAGATVFVERRDLGGLGQTPRSLALPPGKTKVILDLPGYYPVERPGVDLEVGKVATVEVALERIMGTLAVKATPEGAEARLDRADGDRLGPEAKVVPGRHTVWISAPGYVEQAVGVDVPPEGRVPLQVSLVRRPQPAGSLVVRANVEGALVTVDGKEVGFTPGVVEGVTEGDHLVGIVAEGREPWLLKVAIKANERSFVDAKLRYAQVRVEAASKGEERASDAPASVTVITREEIRAFGYQTVAEALRAVRGVYLSDDRSYMTLGFRGFSPLGDYNNRVLILVDGHPVQDPWVGEGFVGHEFDVDLEEIDRIEVVRGAGSALYGAGAFFGVINVVHRAPAEGPHALAAAGLGSLGEQHGRATGSYRASDASVLVTGAALDSTGETFYLSPVPVQGRAEVQNADGERAYHADLRARWGDLQLLGTINTRRRYTPSPLYDTLFGVPIIQDDTLGYGELKYDHRFGGGLGLAARAYYDGSRYHGSFPYPGEGVTPVVNNDDTGGADAVGAELRARLPEVLYNHLTLGAEGQDRFRVFQASRSGDGPPPLDETGAKARNERIASVYVNDDVVFGPRFAVTAGVRADDHLDSFGVSVNPRLAAIAHLYEGATTKLLAGRAFRAPTIYERFYQDGISQVAAVDLQPEVIYSAELEHTHPFTDELSVTGAAFYSDISQLIELATLPSGLLRYDNAEGHVRSVGGEVEARYQPGRSLLIEALYAYQHTRTQDGQELENSPAHAGVVRAMVPVVSEVLTAATEVVYNSPRLAPPDDNGLRRAVGEQLLWNVVLSGEYARYHLRYSAGVFNALDQHYTLPASGTPPGVTIAQYGRTLRLTLGASF